MPLVSVVSVALEPATPTNALASTSPVFWLMTCPVRMPVRADCAWTLAVRASRRTRMRCMVWF